MFPTNPRDLSNKEPAAIKFEATELVPLGAGASNVPQGRWYSDSSVCGIWPPQIPVVQLILISLLIAGFFVGVDFEISRRLNAPLPLAAHLFFLAFGTVTVLAVILGFVLTIKNYQRRGPVLIYHRKERRIVLPAFDGGVGISDVICLQVLAVRQRNTGRIRAELNLLAYVNGERRRSLLLTSLSNSASAFDSLLAPLVDQVPLRVMKAYQTPFAEGLHVEEWFRATR